MVVFHTLIATFIIRASCRPSPHQPTKLPIFRPTKKGAKNPQNLTNRCRSTSGRTSRNTKYCYFHLFFGVLASYVENKTNSIVFHSQQIPKQVSTFSRAKKRLKTQNMPKNTKKMLDLADSKKEKPFMLEISFDPVLK